MVTARQRRLRKQITSYSSVHDCIRVYKFVLDADAAIKHGVQLGANLEQIKESEKTLKRLLKK